MATIPETPPLWRRLLPRAAAFIVLTALLLVAVALISPVQLPVVLYKVCLVTIAGVVGYWLDRAIFPYARPHIYLRHDWRCGPAICNRLDYEAVDGAQWLFIAATVRRAVVILAAVIGVTAGL